jgi:hypothetical protein
MLIRIPYWFEYCFIYEKFVACTVSTSNIEILERFQSKALCMTVDAPWYEPNTVIQRDLQMPTVKEEIRRYNSQSRARLSAHPNESYQTTGDCEDTCQMICLLDF